MKLRIVAQNRKIIPHKIPTGYVKQLSEQKTELPLLLQVLTKLKGQAPQSDRPRLEICFMPHTRQLLILYQSCGISDSKQHLLDFVLFYSTSVAAEPARCLQPKPAQ